MISTKKLIEKILYYIDLREKIKANPDVEKLSISLNDNLGINDWSKENPENLKCIRLAFKKI